MAQVTANEISRFVNLEDPKFVNVESILTNSGDFSEWYHFMGGVSVHAFGATTTSFSVQVETNCGDPNESIHISPAGQEITGDLSSGSPAANYHQYGAKWWRVRATSTPTGGAVIVTMAGQAA